MSTRRDCPLPGVLFNTIWPQYMTATYAVSNNVGANLDHTVTVAHMADPAYRIVTSRQRREHLPLNDGLLLRESASVCGRCHTQFFTDKDLVDMMRIETPSVYQVDPVSCTRRDCFACSCSPATHKQLLSRKRDIAQTAEIFEDFMIEPDGMRNGQTIGYVELPPRSSAASIQGK
eukprot:5030500-Prymnesium_polylepis.1